jgi:hypothetical protein
MENELKKQTRWARWDGDCRWTLGLSPTCTCGTWLRNNYQICRIEKLKSGTLAVMLRATPKNSALLMSLPKPRGGSRHESNWVMWP